MIVEVTSEYGGLIGTYKSPVAPRIGETIHYDGEFYDVLKARSDVRVDSNDYHDELEKFAVLVSRVGDDVTEKSTE